MFEQRDIAIDVLQAVPPPDFAIHMPLASGPSGLVLEAFHPASEILDRPEKPAPVMQKLPKYLNKYFNKNNFILVYPIQNDLEDPYAKTGGTSFLNPLLSGSVHTLENFSEAIGKVFKKK